MPSKDDDANAKTPSLADQWRRHLQAKGDTGEPVLLTLPSGQQVRAGRTNILTLMQRGSIPDALTPKVDALIAAAKAGGTEAVQVAMTDTLNANPAAFHRQWMSLLDAVWLATVIEPRFTIDPEHDPDTIPIDAVSEEDKSYLFSWCQGVTQSVAAFRKQRTGAAASLGLVSEGDEVRDRSAGHGGHRPVA